MKCGKARGSMNNILELYFFEIRTKIHSSKFVQQIDQQKQRHVSSPLLLFYTLNIKLTEDYCIGGRVL